MFSRTRDDDRWLAEVAARQYGVVARRQLVEAGWSGSAIQKRLDRGRLHRLHSGAYAVGHRLIQREGRWLAAVLTSAPDAVLSHWSAAALWEIRPNSRTTIDVTTSHRSRSSPLIHRHLSKIPGDERTVEEGIPVTSVPRTIFDLAATEPLDTVVALIKEAEHLQLYDRLSLADLLDRYPSRRGSRRVRQALKQIEELPPGRTASPLEEEFLPFLRRHRLLLPRLNDWILLGNQRFKVDAHWPEAGQIVELDSWRSHGTRSSFRSDRARDRALAVAGYTVTRLTYAQLKDEPGAIAADLQQLLNLKS
jgi:predicted transcriptional regulator of viral defense system